MGSQEVLEASAFRDARVTSCNGSKVEYSGNVEESENLTVDLLNDFDSYWEDIADGVTVSRMVSDSVIKGMVSAIQQEAADKIAKKELELASLKEMLHLNLGHKEGNGSVRYSMMCHEAKSRKNGHYFTYSNGTIEYDGLQDSLGNLKFAAKEQFKKLKKEIDKIRGPDSIGKKGSSSELLGLSGMDKLIDVDRALDGLRKTLESIYSQTEDMVCLSKSLLLDWQQEREFQAEIEEMLIKNYLQSLQEEFEQRLWDQNAQSYGIESTKQIEKIKEISKLLLELDIISKSLSVPESGHLISHGSLEHRKVSGSHASSPSLWEGNGKHDESVIVVPENLDHSQLELLSKDELFNHLKAEMTKMKRHYELKEHEMTENYFSLKREYLKLKERPSSLPVVKDKEFDTWREKILEIILKLDGILMENEKLPSFSNNGDCLDNLKDRLESLCSENHQLKDLLMDKKKEIKCLSSHVSDAAEVIFELREQVETVTKKLGEVNEKKSMLLSISQKHQNSLSSVEAREREQRKQIKSTIVLVQGLSEAVTNFECRATEYIKINSLRLEELCSQSNSLIQKANALKREEFLYKQRLERRCSDLQKAEAEIMEILKLFRRELSGESV